MIDTPGFDDSNPKHDDSFILREISSWLVLAYSRHPPLLLSGIIYLHPINEVRMKGTSKNNLRMFRAMCGTEPLSCVVLATTMWDKVDGSTGEERQERIVKDYWQDMVTAGSVVMKHDDTKESALAIISHIIARGKQMPLKIQHQIVIEGKTVEQTNAGQEVKSKVNEERTRAERRLVRTRTELEKALSEQDDTAAGDLLKLRNKYEAEVEAKDTELQKMHIKAQELCESRLKSMAKADVEREKRHKDSNERIAEMRRELEAVRSRQVELDSAANPPSHDEVAMLSAQNDALQMQLRRQETERQISKFQEQQKLQVSHFDEQLQLQIQQYRESEFMAAQRHGEQMKSSDKSIMVGSIGAAAGVVSAGLVLVPAVSCSVM